VATDNTALTIEKSLSARLAVANGQRPYIRNRL
jgi:hypothetical protein